MTNSELMRKMQWCRTYDALYASEKNDGAITLNFNIYEIVSLSETPGNLCNFGIPSRVRNKIRGVWANEFSGLVSIKGIYMY